MCDVPSLLHARTQTNSETKFSFWMACLNDSYSNSDSSSSSGLLNLQRTRKKFFTTKWSAGITTKWSGRARSWSGRLKLSLRAVWDSAKIEGLERDQERRRIGLPQVTILHNRVELSEMTMGFASRTLELL